MRRHGLCELAAARRCAVADGSHKHVSEHGRRIRADQHDPQGTVISWLAGMPRLFDAGPTLPGRDLDILRFLARTGHRSRQFMPIACWHEQRGRGGPGHVIH